MPIFLRQSTASQEIPLGFFVDSTDGNTEETGLTIANTDIKIWKTGATTLANKNSGGGTHISNGIYYAVLDATDTDTIGPLVIFCHVSGALTVRLECCVLDEAVYDVWFGTVAPAITGDTMKISSGTGTGQLNLSSGRTDANMTYIAGSAVNTSTAQIGANVIDYASGKVPLQPTVAGRTLDVSSTGEAGVDWANVGSQSTSVTLSGTTVGAVTTVGTVTDKAGYSLSSAGITAIWDKLTSALTTAGSIGKLIVDYLDAAITSRSTFNYASNQVTVAINNDKTGYTVSTNNDKTGYSVTTNNDKTGYTLTTTPATSSDVRTQVDAALDATDAELSSMPAGTSVSLRNRLKFIFQYFRLKRDATATLETMYKDNSTTVLGTAVLSDDGTTVTKAKMT